MIGFDSIEHACRTDVGVRRSHNQDAFGIALAPDAERWRENGHIFVVADGMGGHAVGEKASAKAVRDIPHLLPKLGHESPAAALLKAYVETNAGIHAVGQENPEFRGSGTTASTMWIRPDGAWLAHVGDSRVYRLRSGVLEQLTFDHSAVWEIAKRQGIRPDQLQGIRSNVILRSLGPEATVEVDVEGPHPLQRGDTFLMCSDGLSGQLSDYEIGAIMGALPPAEACDFFVELANLRGGPDNVTVLIARVKGEPPASPLTGSTAELRLGRLPSSLPWPIPVMLLGIVLAIAALLLLALELPGGAIAFGLAAMAVAVGMGGMLAQSRRQPTEETPPTEPATLNAYSRISCQIDPMLIDKLAKAEQNVREKMPPEELVLANAEAEPERRQADASMKAGDLPAAFAARCRAMHAVVRRFNKHRQKEEVFSPVWDKHG